MPRSALVLPPLNESVDVDAASAITRAVLADGGGLVQFERADGTVAARAD